MCSVQECLYTWWYNIKVLMWLKPQMSHHFGAWVREWGFEGQHRPLVTTVWTAPVFYENRRFWQPWRDKLNRTSVQYRGPEESREARSMSVVIIKVGTQQWSLIQLQSAHTQAPENYIKSSKSSKVPLHNVCCLQIIFMIIHLVYIKCKKNNFHEHKVTPNGPKTLHLPS